MILEEERLGDYQRDRLGYWLVKHNIRYAREEESTVFTCRQRDTRDLILSLIVDDGEQIGALQKRMTIATARKFHVQLPDILTNQELNDSRLSMDLWPESKQAPF